MPGVHCTPPHHPEEYMHALVNSMLALVNSMSVHLLLQLF